MRPPCYRVYHMYIFYLYLISFRRKLARVLERISRLAQSGEQQAAGETPLCFIFIILLSYYYSINFIYTGIDRVVAVFWTVLFIPLCVV